MKTVGKIKIDDVMELVKLVSRVHMETEHYAEIQISNFGHNVSVWAMEGGFDSSRKFSFNEDLNLYDPYDQEGDADTYRKIREYLKSLLGENNG